MKPIIEVHHISKQYQIGEKQRYYSFRDTLVDLSTLSFKQKPTRDEFWALKDISFTVMPGEVVGIIGKNGAGKSTLLKILSRITPPTKGEIALHGRVASLLEVGTGFHPELTGRENIYLNGAILGMKRLEINDKFDEIVEFSGISKFLDTPVKHFSSGMYMRLAFAIAAHLNPEILVIDEVLAVGDNEFQKKCLGKMNEVASAGRTVLFVSHNMDSIRRLCNKTILLHKGSIHKSGDTTNTINYYLTSNTLSQAKRLWTKNTMPGNESVKLQAVYAHTEDNKICSEFDIRKKIGITIKYQIYTDKFVYTHGCNLYNEHNVNILNSHDVNFALNKRVQKKGHYSSTVWIPGNFLSEGTITVGIAIFNPNPFMIYLHEMEAISFKVVDDIMGDSARGEYVGGFPGVVRPILNWETTFEK